MLRIKLPGKEKHKKILLMVLVILAIGIIYYEKLGKVKNHNIQSEKKEQEETIKPANIEESDNTTNKEIEKNNNNKSGINNNVQKNEVKKYSEKENKLYDEAYTLFFSHEYDNAINKADLLINEFPSNALGYNIRGIAKAYNGDYEGGMDDVDKSLSIDNAYGYARFNKGLIYELYGKMDQALDWYNKDLEIEEYVWSYYGISSIYGRRGDVENTMTYLNKAIKIDEGVKDVAKNEQDFDPVRNSEEFQKAVYN